MVNSRQLKLLAVLKQNILVNLPFFLNSILHDIVVRIRKAKNPQAVVSHHGLIKLIIIHELNKHHLAWDSFVNPALLAHEENPNREEI